MNYHNYSRRQLEKKLTRVIHNSPLSENIIWAIELEGLETISRCNLAYTIQAVKQEEKQTLKERRQAKRLLDIALGKRPIYSGTPFERFI